MRTGSEGVAYQVGRLAALTLLFIPLHYIGIALYFTADGITTVKPFSGVALALLLIKGRRWLWPVLISGTAGAILTKAAFRIDPAIIVVPLISSGALFLVYHLCQRWIGERIDFRAWKQLVFFIAIAAAASILSAFLYGLVARSWNGHHLLANLQVWFMPTALSYVIFTPVMVLLATAEKGVFRRNWWRHLAAQSLLIVTLALNIAPVGVPLMFMVPLALLLVTMTCEIEGAALGLVVVQLVLTAAIVAGHAPHPVHEFSLGYQLYFMQGFMAILIVVMLPAAAAITERITLRVGMQAALQREEKVNRALRISEQRALEMAQQAQSANKAKSEFLASMSHELRTPLNAILGFSEVLKAQLYGPLGSAKYIEYAEDVHKSGAHLLDLINDVLDLSKIDAGKMELRESVFSISDLVNDAVALVRDKAKDHAGLEVRLDGQTDVRADKRLTMQILINLLSNAIKFTPKGGAITVGVETKSGQGLEIYIADTGIGMDEAQLKKAFSPYGQIDS
ncbi:MAG TPA: histidine kinase dimerization/phospho-acceptor domain-containing protein, partial [Rhizomicrobium sp.]|nr:histidine kinase dimerization/phospho-acceptor domain-containing protein [Rhizomicrobium sp.]